MSGRVPLIALVIAIVGVVLGGAALAMSQGASRADTVKADIGAAVTGLEGRIGDRIAALTADGAAAPVVNAARLGGLSGEQFVRTDVAEAGHANCQGIGMWPWSSDTKYTQTKLGRVVTSGEGFFDCLVFLPNGATITALRALVHDLSPTEQAVCYMIAAPINLTATGASPAYTESSGDAATPGNVIIEDTSIQPATVDNTNFSYLVECWLSGPGNLALKGVSVEYTVAGRPIP